MKMEKFESKLPGWAIEKGIIPNSSQKDQLTKIMEEVGEIAGAIARQDEDLLADAIGDAMIAITILARISDLSVTGCMESAWAEIVGRKGKMKDGIFVKSGDTP